MNQLTPVPYSGVYDHRYADWLKRFLGNMVKVTRARDGKEKRLRKMKTSRCAPDRCCREDGLTLCR